MDYRIEKRDAFKVICKKKQVEKPQGDTATAALANSTITVMNTKFGKVNLSFGFPDGEQLRLER